MEKLIVITGITGQQGGSVANTFLALPGWRVRGITRNPSSDAAKALVAKGVEIVRGEFDDKEALVPAFTGANVIFSNADFFAHFFAAIQSPDLAAGCSVKEYGYKREVAQANNIAEAAASPNVLKTLERFIVSTLPDASTTSGGKYTTVYHFDSKAENIRYIRTHLPELAARMSRLIVGHYVTNWKSAPAMGPQKQPDGSFLMRRSIPPNLPYPFVVTDQDTGSFVKALVKLPAGKALLGVSETMTMTDWTRIWGKVLGVQAEYQQITPAEFLLDVPQPMKEELDDSFVYIEEFGFTGGDPSVLLPDQLDFKIPLTSMEEYIRNEDWSPILKR